MDSEIIENTQIDQTFEIECEMYRVLKDTISIAIDREKNNRKMNFVVPKERILENLVCYNLFMMEESCAITLGPDNRLYLCGSWLMRPVLSDGKMIPMMNHLKKKIDTKNLVFCPAEEGSTMRKELWGGGAGDFSSYNLTAHQKIDTFNDDLRAGGALMNRPENPQNHAPKEI